MINPLKEQAIKSFEEYIKYVDSLESQIRDLQYKNKVLLNSAREIAEKDLIEENNRLKDELKFSIGQFFSQRELDDYNAFCKNHIHDRTTSKVNGGKAPYVIQEGTGIGVITKVKCPICGEEKDITDTEVW